ncbi:unnamed protein product (macronuclear) [Paramecium tetraurelia]|uniref:CS domain-containing protein n=1 Tax=Paramecium tetraurelia TaxID=5888 RepID=A0EDT3_PARTE|nr:uncharacterized protein GSPATT00025794001 [Paramecium tetraurelia]CAK93450.1 unnamed protein product [Paramecium tetraurelia]|eukprot:XP_001460847.1 hypothetical protein (macronuclear) [Paramecium tetraurelia strain d4-2]
MSELEQYQEDLAEVQEWLKTAKRPNNIEYLNKRIKFLNDSIKILQPQKVEKEEQIEQQLPQIDELKFEKITKYAFDQEESKITIIINMEGIGELPKQNIQVEFGKNCFDVRVIGYRNANHRLQIKKTFGDFLHKMSSFKVTKNNIHVILILPDKTQWTQIKTTENIIDQKKEEKEKKKFEKDGPLEDDVKGVLNMLKGFYESDDPEMRDTVRQFMRKTANQQMWKN